MSVTQRRIATNTTFYIAALSVQKVLSFVYFSYLARSLGTDLTGKYFFAMSVAAIITAAIDLGFTPVLTREVAKEPEHAKSILSQIIGLKIIFAAIVAAGVFMIVPHVIDEVIVRHLIYIGVAIAFADSFALTFYATIRAHQNLTYESVTAMLFQVIVIIVGGFAVYRGADIRIIMSAILLASIFNATVPIVVIVKKLGIRFRTSYDWPLTKHLIRLTIPFALAAVFTKLYAYLDTVFLRFMSGDAAVGIYSVAYKATFAFQFLPLAFVAALYPAFSYFWNNDKERLTDTFMRSMHYLLIIAMPITFGVSALAFWVIPAVYTDAYNGAIVPLIVLLSSLPFLFLNFPVAALLNACNKQNVQTLNLGITMALNVVLNLILIPKYGPLGAAIASSVSTLFIFVLGIIAARRLVSFDWSLVTTFIRLVIAAVVMCIVTVAIMRATNWYFAVVPAAVVYLVLIYLLRVVKQDDLRYLKTLVRR